MSMRSTRSLIFLGYLVAGLVSAQSNVIKIASVSPLSGSQAVLGESIKMGAQLSIEEAQLSKPGRLLRTGKISQAQFDKLAELITSGKIPAVLAEYLDRKRTEQSFLLTLNAGGIPGVPGK